MSETFEHDGIAHRLVTALDALPVPTGAAELRGRSALPRMRDPRALIAAALLVVVVTTAATPQLRQALAELTRYIERQVFGPGWSGYYVDLTARDASGNAANRLLFVSSDHLGGVRLEPDVVGALADHGPWSPDGMRIPIYNGSKLYVGDRYGRIDGLTDFGRDYIVTAAGWAGSGRVFAVLSTSMGVAVAGGGGLDGPWALATVDVATGAVDLRRFDQSLSGRAFNWISPDARWLPYTGTTSGCGATASIFDLSAGAAANLRDDRGRQLSFVNGWFSDGRFAAAFCDRAAGSVELFAVTPGRAPVLVATIATGQTTPILSLRSDHVVVVGQNPVTPQTIRLFDPAGSLVTSLEIPALTRDGAFSKVELSRDERTLSFVLTEVQGNERVFRAGVVDLATGQVTYLCAADCARLAIGGR